LSEKFLIHKNVQRDTTSIINGHKSSCQGNLILVRFQRNLNFLHRFSKKSQISDFIKIRPVGVELCHAYERTDRHTDITPPHCRVSHFCASDENWINHDIGFSFCSCRVWHRSPYTTWHSQWLGSQTLTYINNTSSVELPTALLLLTATHQSCVSMHMCLIIDATYVTIIQMFAILHLLYQIYPFWHWN